MAKTSDKRDRLIRSANRLFHRQGFHRTTLADIAREAEVPLGNVYYYFKTKEELCEAVVEERKQHINTTLDICCKKTDPKTALKKLVKYIVKEAEEIADCGCPYAGLCQELDNQAEPELASSADECMRTHVEWSADKFRQIGCKDAEERGFEFMSRIQGTLLMGHAMHDPKLIRRQLLAIGDWVDQLRA